MRGFMGSTGASFAGMLRIGSIMPTVYHPTVNLTVCPICWHSHRDTAPRCPVCGAVTIDGLSFSRSADGSTWRRMASAPGAGRQGWTRLYRLNVESADPE